MSVPPLMLKPQPIQAQAHCFHCNADFWGRTFARRQRCPRCQCKFWDVPHYQGLHPRRQFSLRLAPPIQTPTPQQLADQQTRSHDLEPEGPLTEPDHAAALDALEAAVAQEQQDKEVTNP